MFVGTSTLWQTKSHYEYSLSRIKGLIVGLVPAFIFSRLDYRHVFFADYSKDPIRQLQLIQNTATSLPQQSGKHPSRTLCTDVLCVKGLLCLSPGRGLLTVSTAKTEYEEAAFSCNTYPEQTPRNWGLVQLLSFFMLIIKNSGFSFFHLHLH